MGKTINKMKSTQSYRGRKKKKSKAKKKKWKKKKNKTPNKPKTCPFDESNESTTVGEEKSRGKLLTSCTQFTV